MLILDWKAFKVDITELFKQPLRLGRVACPRFLRSLVNYTGDLQLGGTIAGVGQRMIQGTAEMMAAQFFTALEAEVQAKAGEAPQSTAFFAQP